MQRIYIIMIVISIMAIFIGSYLASYSYEPLDKSAESLNLNVTELYHAPFPEYSVPGLPPELGSVVSGILGAVILLVIFGFLFLIKRWYK